MTMPINKKFKVITEYHNEEPSETICETFEELIGTFFALICLTWLASLIIAIAALCQYFG